LDVTQEVVGGNREGGSEAFRSSKVCWLRVESHDVSNEKHVEISVMKKRRH